MLKFYLVCFNVVRLRRQAKEIAVSSLFLFFFSFLSFFSFRFFSLPLQSNPFSFPFFFLSQLTFLFSAEVLKETFVQTDAELPRDKCEYQGSTGTVAYLWKGEGGNRLLQGFFSLSSLLFSFFFLFLFLFLVYV